MYNRKKLLWPWVLSFVFIFLLQTSSYASGGDIPLRRTLENMTGKVTWLADDLSVVSEVGGVRAQFTAGSTIYRIDDTPYEMPKQAYISPEGLFMVSADILPPLQKRIHQALNPAGFERLKIFPVPGGKAEIVASTPDGRTLAVTQADRGTIIILSISDLSNIKVLREVDLRLLSEEAEVTSTAITPDGKYALATVRTGDNLHNPRRGKVAVIELLSGRIAKVYDVGIGPDSLAVSKDGRYAVVCNEDEEGDPANNDKVDMQQVKRPGTISILDFSSGDPRKGIHIELPIRLANVPGAVYPHDPQPEFAAISPDSKKAAITLQENNAIAIIDLKTKAITRIFSLGTTAHKADLTTNGSISFTQDLVARLEPDGIAWSPDGRYLYTANEGDLGPNEFGGGIWSGGRNLTVWDLEGHLIYDSLDLIDRDNAMLSLYPDKRSDSRGSEPENLTTGWIDGRPILAVACERSSSVLFFDITEPAKPIPVGILPSGGKAPEGIHKISSRNLFVTADEASGTLTFYGPPKAR